MALPKLTAEQTDEARKKALEKRREYAEAKASVKSGDADALDVLNDERFARMRVFHLVQSLPNVGKAKATKFMNDAGIPMNKRLGGLGCRQRETLVGFIEENR